MTAEEIEIIVTARIEEALKEVMKLVPAIKKEVKKIQKAFSEVDMSGLNDKIKEQASQASKEIQKAVTLAKKQIKGINKNNQIKLTVNNKEAEKQISEVSKKIKAVAKQTSNWWEQPDWWKQTDFTIQDNRGSGEGGFLDNSHNTGTEVPVKLVANTEDVENKISEVKQDVQNIEPSEGNTSIWNTIKTKIQSIIPTLQQAKGQIQQFFSSMNNGTSSSKQLELIKYKISEIEEELEKCKNGEIRLKTADIIKAEAELERLNNQKEKLEQGSGSSFFARITSSIKTANSKLSQVIKATASWKNGLNKVGQVSVKVVNKIKQMGTGMKSGLKQVLKYAMALFSLRSIYTALSSSASSWLSSQNAQAQQLSANIDYMKYAMGNAFAPVIEYVINLVYKLMKAIQTLVYALTKVNIFASASASSYSDMADSASDASKATKSLAGVHSEINNVNSSSSSSGSDSSSPNIDLSSVDTELSGFSQKLYDFFSPLLESWKTYGGGLVEQVKTTAGQIVELLKSVWGSFENIITNGTVYTILENILAIIGDIAMAFANAWNYNGNGDKIVQNLANAFNNLLLAIDNVVQSEGFQEFLNFCSDKFANISEKIASIDWQPMINALASIGEVVGTVALTILEKLVDILAWFIEHPTIAEIILGVAIALTTLGTALSIISKLTEVVEFIVVEFIKNLKDGFDILKTAIAGIKTFLTSTLGGIVLVVVGVVTAISSFIDMLKEGFSWMKEIFMIIGIVIAAVGAVILGVPTAIAAVVAAIVAYVLTLLVLVVDLIKEHWEEIKEFFSNLGVKISEIWTSIVDWVKEKIENLKETISNKIEEIKTGWNNAWESVKTFVSDTWEGIKTSVSNAITNLKETISNILDTIRTTWENIWNGITNTISDVWTTITTKVKEGVSGAWNAITSVFGNIKDWFKEKFTDAWQAVKNVFSTGGAIFDGIKDGILSGLKTVVNAIINGINKVIKVPFEGINSALTKIKNINILGVTPFTNLIKTISIPQIPTLATGNVAFEETLAIFGEYSNASTNPEITAPQSIMEETFDRVLSKHEGNNDNTQPIYLTVNVANEKLGTILLDNLRTMKRRSGKGIEALVG